MIKVAINGFGRIGRPSFKIIFERDDMEVVAINDLAGAENLAYLLKYDSAYGVYAKDVRSEEGKLIVDGKEFPVFAEKDPNNLPWKELEIDVVLECTGIFINREGTSGHINAGARKVVISAPAKDESIKTFVTGVNEKEISIEDDIISNASCTTNCLAPIMKVLNDKFGVEKAMMSTVHSYTSTQTIIDVATGKDKRRGRASGQSVIPTTTGAAIATTLVIPSLKGNFDGMAFRIPTLVGSACDLTAILKKNVNEDEINNALIEAAGGELKGILEVTDEALVSHDIVGNSHSAIVQKELTKIVGGNFVKVIAWYDNEWGYSCRLVDMANYLGNIK
jgi:glyceraldehyde 3-phosphate dehydrogenase